MPRRALLIINPNASQAYESQAGALLQAAGFEVIESEMDEIGRRDADLVVIGGGDGTLNAAAARLLEAKLPLGILPLGTANDLARTLGIPSDLKAACDVIAAGHTRKVDLGCVNDHYFFNVASMGLSVAIARRLTKEVKGRWGIFAYLFTAISVLRYARPFHIEIRCDGEVHRAKTVQVTIGNGRYFGGGLLVAEDAAIDDNRLDVYSLEVNHWWQLLKLLPSMRAGTIGNWQQVHAMKGREVEIVTRRSRHVNTDGEVTTRTPATITVLPAALEVFSPTSA